MSDKYILRLVNWDSTNDEIVQEGSDAADPIQFTFDFSQGMNDKDRTSFATTAGSKPSNNAQYGVTGTQDNPVLRAICYNAAGASSGVDYSSTTLSNSDISDSRFANNEVTTLEEQKIWLKEYIRNTKVGAQWRLYGGRFQSYGDNFSNGTPVVVENLNIVDTVQMGMAFEVAVHMRVGVRFFSG